MYSFITPRGTTLTYNRVGRGSPVLCVPGGPLLPVTYLGDLGGLSQHVELILFSPPGSVPDEEADPSAYRCDNVVDDLEGLRRHLALDRVALLGHSAGANIVLRYAERYPEHVDRLLLVAPSTRAVGIDVSDAARSAVAQSRAVEPWYPDAAAALARIQAGDARDDDWGAIASFNYGRWDQVAVDYDAKMNAVRNPVAAAVFGSEGAFDPPATRAALAALRVPVTVIAGAVDVGLPLSVMQQLADVFPRAILDAQAGAGHFPWVDDPSAFVTIAHTALIRQ